MPSPFYRASSGAGPAGKGVSADGYDGAESFFEQLNTVAGELGIPGFPTAAQQSLAGKVAVDAYMTARNGTLTPDQAFFYEGKVPADFPKVNFNNVDLKVDSSVPKLDLGTDTQALNNALSDFGSNFADVLKQGLSSPMGMIGQILGFLFKLFTDVISQIGEALAETARAAASAVEDAWKKQMEMASSATENSLLQPLELYTQSATTQTLSHALKNGAST
jgi:hypothetical protein